MPKRKLPDTNILIADYQNGLSTGQIAEKYGVSNDSVVAKHLRAAGVVMRSSGESARIRFANGSRQATRFWKGKKQPPEMVEKRISKIRGENHYLYKDGSSVRHYRGKVKKDMCAVCSSKEHLLIHHKDFDHFNDADDNLQVLCKSCHISIHKKEYWRCKRENVEYKSNSPIGWNKSKSK